MSTGARSRDGSDGRDPALAQDALRLNDRFLREVVERFEICPFARRSREQGGVARWVLTDATPSAELVSEAVERAVQWGADPTVEIGLLLFPGQDLGLRAFEELALKVRQALDEKVRTEARTEALGRPVFMSAVFHPDMSYATDSPARFMPYFRRAPDPTLQLVRAQVIDDVRRSAAVDVLHFSAAGWLRLVSSEGASTVSDRIERDNFALFTSGALEQLEAVYVDLAGQRKARTRRV